MHRKPVIARDELALVAFPRSIGDDMGALEPHLRGADRVREVFARVANGSDTVADLYANDAIIVYDGGRVEGRDAIRRSYRNIITHDRPQAEVVAVLESPPWYAAVLEVDRVADHVRALDLFLIDSDEGIRRLEVYVRHALSPS
jgi:hypothetical protein